MRRGRLRLAGALGAVALLAGCGDAARNDATANPDSTPTPQVGATRTDTSAATSAATPKGDTQPSRTSQTPARAGATSDTASTAGGAPAAPKPPTAAATPAKDTATGTTAPTGAGREAGAKPGKVTQVEYTGWKQYEVNCARCHGEYGLGSTIAPSLYHSFKTGAVDSAEYQKVVHGSRTPKGMPNWTGMLSEEYLHAIYKYLAGRGAGRIPAGRPTPEG